MSVLDSKWGTVALPLGFLGLLGGLIFQAGVLTQRVNEIQSRQGTLSAKYDELEHVVNSSTMSTSVQLAKMTQILEDMREQQRQIKSTIDGESR